MLSPTVNSTTTVTTVSFKPQPLRHHFCSFTYCYIISASTEIVPPQTASLETLAICTFLALQKLSRKALGRLAWLALGFIRSINNLLVDAALKFAILHCGDRKTLSIIIDSCDRRLSIVNSSANS
ncbi:hypothetical protein NE237_024205 [Protea cynaroides]|uniref:Uncharacterized protein n=1 Tax=Protea cynaroides TaxID=273540 RepID=A0A9Q0HCW9_9MAGN|nr:hypothetical protein NE237_024205 [Protea cynaroides]